MSTDEISVLCDEDIRSRSDFRKWALKNHPDKNNNTSASKRRFQDISQYVDRNLPYNFSKLDCDENIDMKEQTPVNVHNEGNLKVNKKRADCYRTSENWTKIMRHHRFDKPTFDKEQFLKDALTMSPKITALLNQIRMLDEADFKSEKRVFKHFIFSDVKQGGYGAKIISSALVANGFEHCFTKTLQVKKPTTHPRKETFGIISSTAIYDKTFSQKHVKQVLNMYNERPQNIHGDTMRFIVLDSGFKEGIDLFDVKYVHIFENQKNAADLIQAVGRATRSCGQMGLDFKPNEGWKLHIYQYTLTYPNSTRNVFEDYMQYAGISLNNIAFGENLEKMAILSAVDYDLNYNINKFENKVDSDLLEITVGGNTANKMFKGCSESDKCGNRNTRTVPFSLKMLITAYSKKLPKGFNRLLTKDKRLFFCKMLQTDASFCEKVNRLYNPKLNNSIMVQQSKRIIKDLVLKEKTPLDRSVKSSQSYHDMLDDIEDMDQLPFDAFMKRINHIFKEYKYSPIKIENHCVKPSKNAADDTDRVVKLTESQQFVTHYFVPQHFAKGLLIWHSVGTGKTCTAVSVKSFLFERMDYTIIWVTRTTLKEDIWKNMYDKICDHVIREKYREGARDNLRKYLSKRFFPPMSYKQFSNLLEGKNELYNKLVQINGKEDILQKTLVIIDEAHKLYSKDLISMEKPNMKTIENAFDKSKTCKVLLMTGTPIADDPMELPMLLNLVSKNYKFPTKMAEFRRQFFNGNEFSVKGKVLFKAKVKGLISYLNRRFDPRQFTQPVFHEVPVEMSVFDSERLESECVNEASENFLACVSKLTPPDQSNIDALIEQVEVLRTQIFDWKEQEKMDKRNPDIKARIKEYEENLKLFKTRLRNEKLALKKKVAEFNKHTRLCESKAKQEIASCKKTVKMEEHRYQNTVFQRC